MTKKLFDALDACLRSIELGANIDDALKHYPELSHELRPLLITSVQARSLAQQDIPDAVIRRGRARVLRHAAQLRESGSSRYQPVFWFQRLALSMALAFVMILSVTGLVSASSAAVPGDHLYRIKRTWENVRLTFTFNEELRAQLEDQLEQERIEEVSLLLAKSRQEAISFSGPITEQNGNLWQVAGIAVQINASSQMPDVPVHIGDLVKVTGSTHEDGYVEALQIEIVQAATPPPSSAPIENTNTEEWDLNNDNDNLDNDNLEEQIQPTPTPPVQENNNEEGIGNNADGHEDDNHPQNDNNDAQNENDSEPSNDNHNDNTNNDSEENESDDD